MPHHVRTLGVGKTKIVGQIRARGLDGILLTSPENVYYTSGLPTLSGSGNPILFALKNQLPSFVYIGVDSQNNPDGQITLFCWMGATMGFTFDVDDVRSFFNWDSALGELHDFLQATLPTLPTLRPNANIGIESSSPYAVLTQLHEFVSPTNVTVVDDLLLHLRFSKTEKELALMRQAVAIVEATVAELRGQITIGTSRLWLINAAKYLMLKHGASGIGHTTIAFGTSNPEIAFDEILEAGKLVTLDLGAIVDGYTSDNRRLCYTGAVPDDLRTLHSTMCDIVNQVGQSLRPGLAFADVYNLATEIYISHDLPPFFISAGHSIGLQTEEAWISPDSTYAVQTGMVINIELYTPYHDGSNIGDEETFLVTESGVVKLTESDPAIQSI